MAKKKIDYAALFTLRKDGRYMGYWRDRAGQRHAVYDRDPEALYNKIQEKENAGPEPVTFRQVAEKWEEDHVSGLARSSQTTYRAPLRELIEEFGDIQISEITPADINRVMLSEKAKGYSYKHAAAKKSLLKQIFDAAIIDEDIPVSINPVSSVSVPRGMKRGKIEAPETEVIDIVQNNLHQPFGDFVAMLLYTGMRTEEAAALKWSDVGKEYISVHCAVDLHGTPIIKEAKTEAGVRDVPILDKHRPFLKRPVGAKADDYIFNHNGRLLTRGQITNRWLNWCKVSGLAERKVYENRHRGEKECARVEWRPLISPHQLRHHYATVLFEQEIDELTAKDIMGHKDITTTREIYTSLRKKHKEGQHKKINAGF